MGGGRSEGANPGPLLSHPFSELILVQSEGAIPLLRRNQFAKRILKFILMSAKKELYD